MVSDKMIILCRTASNKKNLNLCRMVSNKKLKFVQDGIDNFYAGLHPTKKLNLSPPYNTTAYWSSPVHGVSVSISWNFQFSTCKGSTMREGRRGFPVAMENVVQWCWVSFKRTELLLTGCSGRLWGSKGNSRVLPFPAGGRSGVELVWSELAVWSYRKLLNLMKENERDGWGD